MSRFQTAQPLQLDRRQVIAVLGGTAFGGFFGGRVHASAATGEPVYVSSAMLQSGRHAIATVSASGELLATLPLPDRGHDFAVRADGLTVAFARRPGTFAVAFRPRRRSDQTYSIFASPANRHFNGHGAFSRDGRLLYASENDYDAAIGCIGIYDTQNFDRIGEVPSGGIGPHEILRLPNGFLAIANGGIATHPDFPRAKLNLDTMRANITILDPNNGDIIDREELPQDLHQLSIRHMAWSKAANELWFGCQWEGEAGIGTPLVGRYRIGGTFGFLPSPAGGWEVMRDYIGSVATDADGQTIAVTSPRGGRAIVWKHTGQLQSMREMSDVSGVAFEPSAPTFSNGSGALRRTFEDLGSVADVTAFDNHLEYIG